MFGKINDFFFSKKVHFFEETLHDPIAKEEALYYIVSLCFSEEIYTNMCYASLYVHHLGLDARKPVFGVLRITQAQTSLRIRAV